MECQRVKAEHRHPAGLLHPLTIPEWKWEVMTMYFITGLPRTSKQHDAIMVVVDKLTKTAHFIPLKTTHKATNVANIYMKEITHACMAFNNEMWISFFIMELKLSYASMMRCGFYFFIMELRNFEFK
jgi:hypothetical protein